MQSTAPTVKRLARADERPWAGRRLHLIGLGGAGMSGYARVATQLGAAVSGSDRADSAGLRALGELGVEVHVGHDAANVPAGEGVEVVHSTAIAPDNPERAAARERGLPDRPRAELLAELSALKRTIAVAGAHGKTTTTSMAAHVLLRCGLEPAYLIGGALTTTGLNADWGAGEWLVVEADESDRSMLSLDVDVAVVTNVELDHHATFGSLAEVREVFRELLAGAPQAVLWDRPDVLALRGDAPLVPFDAPAPSLDGAARASTGAGTRCACAVPGAHNARNAAAALEACRARGRRPRGRRGGLADFAGAGRRFQALGATSSGASWSTTTPTTRPRWRPPSMPPGRWAAPGGRRLPAPPVLAHAAPRGRVRRGAGRRRRGRRARRLPGARARRGLPRRQRAARGRGRRRRRRRAHGAVAADLRRRRARPARLLRDGDLCLVLGAGDVDELGRRLAATG